MKEPIKYYKNSIEILGITVKGKEGKIKKLEEVASGLVFTPFEYKMMRDIAISLATGIPLIMQGGTGIGKTTNVEAVTSMLGLECFKTNGGKGDPEYFFGAPAIDKDRSFFKPNKLTESILKGCVIFVDEANMLTNDQQGDFQMMSDAISKHKKSFEIRNGDFTIPVHKETKLIMAQNPAEGDYRERHPFDKALIDRLWIINYPENLPEETRKARMLGSIGVNNELRFNEEDWIFNNPKPIDLSKIPGIKDIFQKYLNQTKALRQEFEKGTLGHNEAQKVNFATPRDQERFLTFLKHFYNPDVNINQTVQQILNLIEVQKLSDKEGREKVRDILSYVKHEKRNSKRKSLGDVPKEETNKKTTEQTYTTSQIAEQPWKKIESVKEVNKIRNDPLYEVLIEGGIRVPSTDEKVYNEINGIQIKNFSDESIIINPDGTLAGVVTIPYKNDTKAVLFYGGKLYDQICGEQVHIDTETEWKVIRNNDGDFLAGTVVLDETKKKLPFSGDILYKEIDNKKILDSVDIVIGDDGKISGGCLLDDNRWVPFSGNILYDKIGGQKIRNYRSNLLRWYDNGDVTGLCLIDSDYSLFNIFGKKEKKAPFHNKILYDKIGGEKIEKYDYDEISIGHEGKISGRCLLKNNRWVPFSGNTLYDKIDGEEIQIKTQTVYYDNGWKIIKHDKNIYQKSGVYFTAIVHLNDDRSVIFYNGELHKEKKGEKITESKIKEIKDKCILYRVKVNGVWEDYEIFFQN